MAGEVQPAGPPHRLIRWQRMALYLTGASLLFTAGLWLAVHYSIGAGAGALPHPLEAWALRLHGLAAFAGLFVLGVFAGGHIPQGWRASVRNGWPLQRQTGLFLCISGALLILSGYLLFYFAPEEVRPALGWAHTVIGVSMAGMIVSHRRGV